MDEHERLPYDFLPEAIPAWDEGGRVHNWKNHVPGSIRDMWMTFTPEQRTALARWADRMASDEEWD